VEKTSPRAENATVHAWTDGSFRKSSGIGWIVTADADGRGDAIAQGSESLGTRQTAFDAEVAASSEPSLGSPEAGTAGNP